MSTVSQTKNTLPEVSRSSQERVEFVRALAPGSRIHVSGICGTGTAAVASLLHQLGYWVSGSDKAFYPPMGPYVRTVADQIFESYSEENLKGAIDLVVIGNSLSRGNEEVEYLLAHNIPYASMPEIFQALLIGTKDNCRTSVVVAGTHGKTTTTAMIATMLDHAQWGPGYFIGGIPNDLPANVRSIDQAIPSAKRTVVLEGDEYDSAFFAKWPKFHSYRPDLAVITSLEFDHADIYESLEQIELEFTRFAERVPADGWILLNDQYTSLTRLAELWKNNSRISAPVFFYGENKKNRFRCLARKSCEIDAHPAQEVCFQLDGKEFVVKTRQTGAHSAYNLLAAAAAGTLLHLEAGDIAKGLEKYSGVRRRQHQIAEINEILVIEDFAHHPTAVRMVLQGLKESYPAKRLVAVFEPRSNTSRRAFFQEAYAKSFSTAQLVVIQEVKDAGGYSNTQCPVIALDVKKLTTEIAKCGSEAYSFKEIDQIAQFLLESLQPGDVVVVMSNGDFGGLLNVLVEGLEEKYGGSS